MFCTGKFFLFHYKLYELPKEISYLSFFLTLADGTYSEFWNGVSATVGSTRAADQSDDNTRNGGQARLLYAGRGSYGIVKGTYLSKGQSNIDFSFKNQIEN